jgi:hypothetical protein
VTPVPTVTPSPTSAPTCNNYYVEGAPSIDIEWTECDGTTNSETVTAAILICAQVGSVYSTGGEGNITQLGSCSGPPPPSVTPTSTVTPSVTPDPTPCETPTPTPTASSSIECQQIYLYPGNSNPCDHGGDLTLFDTDNALAPTRLWLNGECGITPVMGGGQWYSQGPGGESYQIADGGIVQSAYPCS